MLSSRKLVPALAGLLAASSVAGATTATATSATAGVAVAAPTLLTSLLPAWAASAPSAGATPAAQPVHLLLALKGRDSAGLAAYATAASTPGNALYRHWLTADDVRQHYAADSATVDAVTAALKAVGATAVTVDAMNEGVYAVLPASVASTLFGVTFHQVMHAGVSCRVTDQDSAAVPASLAGLVTSVSGLTYEPVHTDHTTPQRVSISPPGTGVTPPETPVGGGTAYFNAGPKSSYYGEKQATDQPTGTVLSGETSPTKPYIVGGYTPAQIRGAYDADKTKYTGKGVTAAVVLWFDGSEVGADLAQYSKEQGLPVPNYTDLGTTGDGDEPVTSDAAGEQTLDVEAIHTMAPDAAIVYSGAVTPEMPDLNIAEVRAIPLATVVNNSWGGTGDTSGQNITTFKTEVTDVATSMGVTINFSSGDAGDNVTANNKREADFPSTSDGVTSVGGTGIEIGKNNDYQGEFYWGTYSASPSTDGKSWGPFLPQSGGAGGGGGLSTAYAEPAWQQGIVPASLTKNSDTATTGIGGATPGRVLPDIAMIADSTTGFIVGQSQTPDTIDGSTPNETTAYSYYRIGGTSVSSPIFSGLMADVDQALGKGAGLVGPTIYPFLAKHDGAFRDPQIGRSATGSRLPSTTKQVVTKDAAGNEIGAGPGVVPVVSEVRPDYSADTANLGVGTCMTDPALGAVTTPVCTKGGNAVTYHLRGQGVLGTLSDLPGYDDSTGLGSPSAPQFIADFVGTSATPAPALPDASAPVALVALGMTLVGGLAVRRRRRTA